MRWAQWILLVVAFPAVMFAQESHFGLKAGVPMMQSFETDSRLSISSPIRRYTVGASVELRFGNHFGVEVDGLYKRIGYTVTEPCGLRCQPGVVSLDPQIDAVHLSDTLEARGNSWEFPILAKFRFPRPLHLFFAGGISVRHVGQASLDCFSKDNQFGSGVPGRSLTTVSPRPCGSELPNRNFAGSTVSAGIEVGPSRFRLLPEFRYTRWFQTDRWDTGIRQSLSYRPRFTSDQAEFLLGFLF